MRTVPASGGFQPRAGLAGGAGAGGRRRVRFVVVAAVLLSVRPAAAAAPQAYDEPAVQAEFVERFTRFIEWPAEEPPPDRPFVIGMLGPSPVAPYLERLATSRRIKGRPIVLRRLVDAAEVDGCEVVWIAVPEAADLAAILARTSGRPILTISDREGFGARGVLVNFRREGQRLQFEINQAEVKKSGLRFSSQLLQLARDAGPEAPHP